MKDFLLRNFNKVASSAGLRLLSDEVGTNPVKMLNGLLRRFQIDLILDVGANVGQSSQKFISSGFTGNILSFEPIPGPFNKLKNRASKNPKWKVFQAAIGDLDGETEIHVAGNLESSSVLSMLPRHKEAAPESDEISKVKTPLRRLDSYKEQGLIHDNDRIFLKIDVQGFEIHALKGGMGILSQVQILQIELSLVPLYDGSPLFEEMLLILKQHGFTLFSLVPGFTDPKTGQLLQMDGIFVRE
jgi:FkbM family methyltransferase